MSKVIDLFKKKEPEETYYTRLQACLKTEEETGQACQCKLCQTKERLSDELIDLAMNKLQQYNKYSGEKLSYGDLLEVLYNSTMKVKNKLRFNK